VPRQWYEHELKKWIEGNVKIINIFLSLQEDGKKADWRKKHESFIEAIRAAKG
jgi:hypothetical protein